MLAELRARREFGKHCRFHGRDLTHQLCRNGAQGLSRGMRIGIPFEIKPFPAAFKEGVKTGIVMILCRLNMILQTQRLFANDLPVFRQFI